MKNIYLEVQRTKFPYYIFQTGNNIWLKYILLLAVLSSSFVFALFVVTVGFLTTLTLPPISAAASMILLIRVSCNKIFK